MRNWSTDIKKLKKNREKFAIWKLEQMVNFGLGGKKIKKSELKKHWKIIFFKNNFTGYAKNTAVKDRIFRRDSFFVRNFTKG